MKKKKHACRLAGTNGALHGSMVMVHHELRILSQDLTSHLQEKEGKGEAGRNQSEE